MRRCRGIANMWCQAKNILVSFENLEISYENGHKILKEYDAAGKNQIRIRYIFLPGSQDLDKDRGAKLDPEGKQAIDLDPQHCFL
jgi:hypothetical protein